MTFKHRMHKHYRHILKSLDGCQCIHLTSIHWHAVLLPLICIKLKISRLFDVWACRSPHVEDESKMPAQLALVDTYSVIIISLDYVTLIFLLGIWICFVEVLYNVTSVVWRGKGVEQVGEQQQRCRSRKRKWENFVRLCVCEMCLQPLVTSSSKPCLCLISTLSFLEMFCSCSVLEQGYVVMSVTSTSSVCLLQD